MNSNTLLKMFRNTALAVALTASLQYVHAAQAVDKIVAVVDNSAILQSDLDSAVAAVKQQFEQNKQSLPPEEIIRKNVLNQLILRQAQIEQVKRYGVKPSEAELNEAVLSLAQQHNVHSLQEFQQQLDQQGAGTYAALRSQVAEELSINRLRQQQVMSRIQISERDVDNFLKSPQGQAALGNQVHTLHFRVAAKSNNTASDTLKKTAVAVKQALANTDDIKTITTQFSNDQVDVSGMDAGFRAISAIPADLAARVSGLAVGQTTELIPANDGIHILKVLERKSDDTKKAIIKQYQTQHILIQPSEVLSEADAKQRIQQIYQRLSQGADFSELAATYSNDPGSARDGGSLGWVQAGVMVPEFEKVMTSTPVGQISQPFQTQYGWHILKVSNIRDTDMTNELQRRMARQILGERQFDSEVDGWLRELRANTYVDIKDPSLRDDDDVAEQAQPSATQETAVKP